MAGLADLRDAPSLREPADLAGPADLVGLAARGLGHARLVHPFPSFLDAAVVAGLATLGGAGMPAALRAGAAMLLLQFAIGATNDLADAPADRRAAPAKPIPAGLVTPRAARLVALAAGPVGLLLVATGGPASLVVAAAGLAVGLLHDRRLKGTAWSWLPYALGIPLLVTFGWAGAGLPLPGLLVLLAPLADHGRCPARARQRARRRGARPGGRCDETVATRLGRAGASRLVALHAVLVIVSACSPSAGPRRCSLPVASDVHPVGGRDLVPAARHEFRAGRNGGVNR